MNNKNKEEIKKIFKEKREIEEQTTQPAKIPMV